MSDMRCMSLLLLLLSVSVSGAAGELSVANGESPTLTSVFNLQTERRRENLSDLPAPTFTKIKSVLQRFDDRPDVQRTRATWKNTSDTQIVEAVVFLIRYAPKKDENLTIDYIVDNVRDAFEAREAFPWGLSIPWSIFLNDVLPYAVINEHRDPWRPLFLRHFWETYKTNLTSNKSWTTFEAVHFMNKVAWTIVNPPIVYKASPPDQINYYSPFTVMRHHYASCTGLSVFFTCACRSVGIPVRLAGTPHWNRGPKACPHGDQSDDCGNHDWVEVFVNGSWSFDGLNGGYNAVYPTLNTSWFFPNPAEHQVAGVTNHSINAVSWAPSSIMMSQYKALDFDYLAMPREHFPMVWNWTDHSVKAFEVTRRYLQLANETKRTQGQQT